MADREFAIKFIADGADKLQKSQEDLSKGQVGLKKAVKETAAESKDAAFVTKDLGNANKKAALGVDDMSQAVSLLSPQLATMAGNANLLGKVFTDLPGPLKAAGVVMAGLVGSIELVSRKLEEVQGKIKSVDKAQTTAGLRSLSQQDQVIAAAESVGFAIDDSTASQAAQFIQSQVTAGAVRNFSAGAEAIAVASRGQREFATSLRGKDLSTFRQNVVGLESGRTSRGDQRRLLAQRLATARRRAQAAAGDLRAVSGPTANIQQFLTQQGVDPSLVGPVSNELRQLFNVDNTVRDVHQEGVTDALLPGALNDPLESFLSGSDVGFGNGSKIGGNDVLQAVTQRIAAKFDQGTAFQVQDALQQLKASQTPVNVTIHQHNNGRYTSPVPGNLIINGDTRLRDSEP